MNSSRGHDITHLLRKINQKIIPLIIEEDEVIESSHQATLLISCVCVIPYLQSKSFRWFNAL
jgi:hypothetical protein